MVNYKIDTYLKIILYISSISLISAYFIEKAKELPSPNISRTEYELKDELVRQTILDTQEDVDDIKESLDRIEDKLYNR